MAYALTIIGVLILLYILKRGLIRKIIVYDYERGLYYQNGKLKKIADPGTYWTFPSSTTIQKIDIRLKSISIPSQEVLSSDHVTIKITLAAQYEITDPLRAINKVEKYQDAFYLTLQLALRKIIGALKIDEVLENRQEMGRKIFELTESPIKEFGLSLKTVDIKDIMFPGDLKKIFTQVIKAQKEGLAALEKARGETASLRNLANAAKMIENNPALMQLRILQSLGEGSGNTMVLGMPPQVFPFPVKESTPDPIPQSEKKQPQEES